VKDYIEKLEKAVEWTTFLQRWLARYPLIVVFRLFKAFHAQPRLALVTLTIQESLEDLKHFLIVFFCVMLGFVTSAVVIFGREVPEVVTFERGLIWCTRLLFGDIEWVEMTEAGRSVAGIWLGGFMIVASLLLLNMLLAIVMDAYSAIKSQCSDSEPLWHQISLMIKHVEGTHVPLNAVIKAFELAVPEDLVPDPKEPPDDEQVEARMSFDRSCLKVEDFVKMAAKPQMPKKGFIWSLFFGRPKPKIWNMEEHQAEEIILGAILDYYKTKEEEAENWNFIVRAEKINDRTQGLLATHKRFSGREEVETEDMHSLNDLLVEDDDKQSEAGDEEGGEEDDPVEEERAAVQPPAPANRWMAANDATQDVKEVMKNLRDEFLKFIQDYCGDRENSVLEIARLTAEVEALRDRLNECSTLAGVWDPLPVDGPSTPSNVKPSGPPGRRPPVNGRLERLEEERTSEAGSDDQPSISTTMTEDRRISAPRSSTLGSNLADHAEAADRKAAVAAAVYGAEFPLSRGAAGGGQLRTARAPAPLSLPSNFDNDLGADRSAMPQPMGGQSPSYLSLMQHHRILPDDYGGEKAPSDTLDAEWPDEISDPGSSPHGSQLGSSRRRPRSAGAVSNSSSGGSGRFRDDFNIMELDLGDDDLNLDDFSNAEDHSVSDGDPGEGPTSIPPASGPSASGPTLPTSRVNATRVARGVGLSRDELPEVPEDSTNQRDDFEFTNFKDAQKELRNMLMKHKPAARILGAEMGDLAVPAHTTSV
jgi:hypothetical protein